jgi:hypothetical protein
MTAKIARTVASANSVWRHRIRRSSGDSCDATRVSVNEGPMKIAGQIIGALWILQGLALAAEEIMRVMRAEEGVSLVIALLLYAIVVGIGVYIMVRAKGWTVVAGIAAAYQGGSHFIFLSNMWPRLDYNAVFALLVVSLAIATVILVVLEWASKRPDVDTGGIGSQSRVP